MQPNIRSAQFVFTRDTAKKMRVAVKCKYRPKVSIFGQLARTLLLQRTRAQLLHNNNSKCHLAIMCYIDMSECYIDMTAVAHAVGNVCGLSLQK